ncbi:MAG: nucleotide exchange factor GrpE [Burkholderiales bacterium]|nr:nucleotide exchange factor GrpE [Burkholderiales bacterium]
MQEEKAPQQGDHEDAISDTIPTDQPHAGPASGEAPLAAADDLARQLEEARAAVLYARAEAENIRRRAAEDVQKASRFAVEKFAGSLLSVRDSLEAALATDPANGQALREGVELTLKQLVAAFEGAQVRADDPLGQRFDPNRHQAMSMVESDQPANTVVAVMVKGYTLHDRVLRPALVTVAKGG